MLAQEAHAQLGLDVVVFMPFGHPPHREIEQDPGPEVRFAMCERAIGGDERFSLSRLEIDRPGLSYTVETLRTLHDRGTGEELVLILGGDQAVALPAWHEPAEILSLATVGTAWCSYQATAWGGAAQGAMNRSTASSRRAATQQLQSYQMALLDVLLFSQHVNASGLDFKATD